MLCASSLIPGCVGISPLTLSWRYEVLGFTRRGIAVGRECWVELRKQQVRLSISLSGVVEG